ncbi:VanZ family protein [Desulfolithobacter sp.]
MNRWYRYIPLVLVMGIIFYLSHQPGDTLELPDLPDIDKLCHALAYGALAGSAIFAVRMEHWRCRPLYMALLVLGFCLGYGISDEFHQSFIAGRDTSGWDVAADMTGAMLTQGGWLWYLRQRFGVRLTAMPANR